MVNARRVLITGLGTTSPLGGDVKSTWDGVLHGRSGAAGLDPEWVSRYDLPVSFACRLAEPAEERLTRSESKRLDPSGRYALVASREAWADAGRPDVEPERLGVALASGIGGVWTLLDAYDTLRDRGPRRVLPMTVPMLMPNGPAAAVGLELGARAGVRAPVSACSSGAEAIAMALDMIRSGVADVVVAGGTEAAIHPVPVAGFAAMHALSTRNDDPEAASRPYDVDRDGFVLGEGSGVLVLESEEHAAARGARVYGELAGAGITSDAHHIAAPDPVGAGASRAMRAALADADLAPRDVVHVNAHATSTPVGDVAEIIALHKALGDHPVVTSTKSMTGHLLGAAGAVESIATILAIHNGVVPPTINLDDPDDALSLDVAAHKARHLDIPAALNNSFGFGGHNVALVFTRA